MTWIARTKLDLKLRHYNPELSAASYLAKRNPITYLKAATPLTSHRTE